MDKFRLDYPGTEYLIEQYKDNFYRDSDFKHIYVDVSPKTQKQTDRIMEFSENKPIYKQIVEYFYGRILNKEWEEGERVPSVREIAVLMEVNPNTAIRAFHELQEQDVLYNKRGVGYFVAEEALQKVKKIKREEFIEVKLPTLFKDMNQLDISFSDLEKLYNTMSDKE